jgi:hypothetical protein
MNRQLFKGVSSHGEFHPEAIRQMKDAGKWLKVNGEAIYASRARDGANWSEADAVRYYTIQGSAICLRDHHQVAGNAGDAEIGSTPSQF